MSDPTPLGPFLDWLEQVHRYPLTAGDRERADRFLQHSGVPDQASLRISLAALLTRDPDAYAAFPAHFDAYFLKSDREVLDPSKPFDRDSLFVELRQVPEPAETVVKAPTTLRPSVEPQAEPDDDVLPTPPPPPVLARVRRIPWPDDVPRPWAADSPKPERPRPRLRPSAFTGRRAQTFFLSDVLPPPRMLDDGVLDELAESMGYFRSVAPSDQLDADATVEASVEAGHPVLCFQPARELGRVLLLEDVQTGARRWNSAALELAEGLEVRGIPVTHGKFRGSPETFSTADLSFEGHLDDWDEDRERVLLLMVTDGAGMFPPARRLVLEDLATWPRVVWIELREAAFWDDGTALAAAHRIPVFESTPDGLGELATQLLSELGSTPSKGRPCPSRDDETVLGSAIAWAAACSRLPVVTPGMADALRRQFFPQLPRHALGRMMELRGAHWQGGGIALSQELIGRMDGYFRRMEPGQRQAVHQALADLFFAYMTENRSAILHGSPAALTCEMLGLTFAWASAGDRSETVPTTMVERIEALGGLGGACEALWQDNLRRLLEVKAADADPALLRSLGLLEDRPTPPLAEDMVVISGGEFLMGDWSGEGDTDERPPHRVHVSTFALGRDVVTWKLWQEVRTWGVRHGYDLEGVGSGNGELHPVTDVSWHDVVKWCNARSEMEGKHPCYHIDAEHSSPYRTGTLDLGSDCVDWDADGYRLPTEAEWEKAARGGLEGHHYPWESSGEGYEWFISPDRANYNASQLNSTTRVDRYDANGFGLRDMAGNVWQWVWDWEANDWYSDRRASQTDTRGPDPSALRVIRGGSWGDSAGDLRCDYRLGGSPSDRSCILGFRLATGPKAVGEASGGGAARRDDERHSRSERATPKGCLIVQAPAFPQIAISARKTGASPSAQIDLLAGRPKVLEPGPWTVTAEAPEYGATQAEVLVEADAATEATLDLIPKDFVRIPEGEFEMGDPGTEGWEDERPVHTVVVSEFWMNRYPVRWDLWQRVAAWASGKGYDLGTAAAGTSADHPVHSVSWWDAIKWCNAYSEMLGRTPAYFSDETRRTILRSGEPKLTSDCVDWTGPGFRLPTEVEWEKAARGGLRGHHYPWLSRGGSHEDHISPEKANFSRSGKKGTTPVGSYSANGFGLHDMAGNVYQWVWDWLDGDWYKAPESAIANTRGPARSASRVIRGGGWGIAARYLRCAYRYGSAPSRRYDSLGFRLAAGRVLEASGKPVPPSEVRRDDEPSEGGAGEVSKVTKWWRRLWSSK